MPYGRVSVVVGRINGANALAVFNLLTCFAKPTTCLAVVSLETISEYLAMDRASVCRGIKSLLAQRVIEKVSGRRGGCNAYRLHPVFFVSSESAEWVPARVLAEYERFVSGGVNLTLEGVSIQQLSSVNSTIKECQFDTHSDIYQTNIKHTNQTNDENFVANEHAGKAVVSSVEAIVTKVEEVSEATLFANSTQKPKRPKREYHPEAWAIVDFYQGIHRELFPLETYPDKWRMRTRTTAQDLIERAGGDVDEVKRRMIRMRDKLPRGKESIFGNLAALKHQWEKYGPNREEAARLTGYQAALEPLDPTQSPASRAAVTSEVLDLKASFLGAVADEPLEKVGA